MTCFITIPPFVLPSFTWLVYLLLPGAPHPRQAENIARQRARQAACSTTYQGGSFLYKSCVRERGLGIVDHLRRRFARFKSAAGRTRCGELCTHFLDLRCLLFELRRENFHPFLLLRDR